MPAQTTLTDYIFFPDGAQVAIDTGSGFNDIGAISTAVQVALNYDVNEFETANAGKLQRQIRNMTMAGSFTLINLDIDRINELGGGMFSVVDTAASPVATIPDQDIAAGWVDENKYELIMYTSSTDSTKLRMSTQPVLTSVTADPSGSPEVLAEGTDYVICEDSDSSSGWSIQFISGNFDTASEGDLVTIVYDTNTPIASSTLYCGTSTQVLTAYAMRIRHTDSNSKVRELNLFSVNMDSGGFQFNYKGAQEDGVEEMPLAFTAQIDTSLTDGRQLFSWKVDAGAA